MDGTRMVRILGNEIPVVGPPRAPLPTVSTRFPARLLDSRRRQDRAQRRNQVASFRRARATHLSVLDDALLVLGAQALEAQQVDGEAARLIELIHHDRAAAAGAARTHAGLTQLVDSRARIAQEQAQLANSPAVDAAARRLHLAQQLTTVDAAIAARSVTPIGGQEQHLTRDLGRYALESGKVSGVNPDTIAQAQNAQLKVSEADAAIEGYQQDLAALDALAPPLPDLVALIGLAVSLIIALSDISGGFWIGAMACGAIGAAAAPFLVSPRSRYSPLLRGAAWIVAMVGLSSAARFGLDAGPFPIGAMIGVAVVSIALVGAAALARRRGVVNTRLGMILLLLATAAVEGNIVSTHFRLVAQAKADQADAQAQHVALLRRAVELFCSGKVDDELVGLEPLLADVPWTEFDKTSEAKLRALVAQRPKLLKIADALRLQASAVQKQGDARSDADRLEGRKTEEECTSTIKFWNESFNMRFFVVADEGGGTFSIRYDGGEGHLMAGAGRWTTTGWADARVSNPSANMFLEVPPASQTDALACQQAFAKRNQNKATTAQAEQQLRVADQQLHTELESIGQGFAATCREIDSPAKVASVIPPVTPPTPPPPANDSVAPVRHDFTAEGIPFSVLVPAGASPSSHSTGKGTMHADVAWPSSIVLRDGKQVQDAPIVEVTDWQGEKCQDDAAPAGAHVERNERVPGERQVLYYKNTDNSYGALVCDSHVGYHCFFDEVATTLASKALEVCLSVERIGAAPTTAATMPPPIPTPAPGPSCAIASLNCDQFSTKNQVGRKLHALVFAAEQGGRHAEAICLARSNVTSSDKWLAGAANFDSSRAWDGLGCHEQAVAAIETSLAVRPRNEGGWAETCDFCKKLGGTCAQCGTPLAVTSPDANVPPRRDVAPGAPVDGGVSPTDNNVAPKPPQPTGPIDVHLVPSEAVRGGYVEAFENGKLVLSPGAEVIQVIPGHPRTLVMRAVTSEGEGRFRQGRFRDKTLVVDGTTARIEYDMDLFPDCTASIVDPKIQECRRQFCEINKSDPKCGLE